MSWSRCRLAMTDMASVGLPNDWAGADCCELMVVPTLMLTPIWLLTAHSQPWRPYGRPRLAALAGLCAYF